MENASKAAVMAGAVIIALAIISLALYAYASFSDYAKASEELLTLSQIESFNRFYQSFPEGTNTIRGVDVVNIINKAIDDEIPNVSAIPAGLTGPSASTNFLTTYDYSLGYDANGRVNRITIN